MREEFEERPRRRPSRPPDDDDIEERPRPRARDDEEDDEYERRPRKKKRRQRYVDCPHCDSPGRADRVAFTWWGGFIGPALLTHVRCRD
jgi:hypothetical protein